MALSTGLLFYGTASTYGQQTQTTAGFEGFGMTIASQGYSAIPNGNPVFYPYHNPAQGVQQQPIIVCLFFYIYTTYSDTWPQQQLLTTETLRHTTQLFEFETTVSVISIMVKS